MRENPSKHAEAIDEASLEQIWDSAINQNDGGKTRAALEKADKGEAFEILRGALERIDIFENTADKDQLSGMKISRDTAERIGSIWLFSGSGLYDKPLKEIDGPALTKEFLKGANRRRIDHGVWLARRIAEMRSGEAITLPKGASLAEKGVYYKKMKEMMAEFSPYIIFGGHDIENKDVENVLEREGIIIPKEKVAIATRKDGLPMKTTTDQVRSFESPEEVRDKEVAFVSDGTHLNRILHIAGKFHDNLPDGKAVNLFPSPTPEYGREEFAQMEARGLLAYIYRDEVAAKEPYPYTLER